MEPALARLVSLFESTYSGFNFDFMTQKLYKLGVSISIYEGWFAGGTKNGRAVLPSVSYRNHNPGNLRSSPFQLGVRDGFAYFYNDDIGFYALLYDLWIKASGRSTSGLKASSTLKDLIFVYAPPIENNSSAYLEFILRETGFKETTKLSELLAN